MSNHTSLESLAREQILSELQENLMPYNHSFLTTGLAVKPLMSDSLYAMFDLVLVQILLLVISSCGVCTNCINILVYAKMGISDTNNMNFLALSVSDLITVIYMAMTGAGHIPAVTRANLPIDLVSIQNALMPLIYPVMAYGSLLTAVISTERCICIVFPMKVKSIITVRRMFIVIMVFLVFELSSLVPHYSLVPLRWEFSPLFNKTILIVEFNEYSGRVSITILLAFFSVPSLISFLTVIVCTSFLVIKLNQSLAWRKSIAQEKTSDKSLPVKELRVVRSVVSICVIYIVCFFLNVLSMPLSLIYPPFHAMNPYLSNVVFTLFYLGCVLQSISSSVNIFVYYNMSTKYQQTLVSILFRKFGT